jgi:hypothetical protein
MEALSIQEVLASEAKAIHGEALANLLPASLGEQSAQSERLRLNADRREDTEPPANEVASAFYCSLNKLNRAALCCSGEGVRSSTFCLGVIQALAGYDVSRSATPHEVTANRNEELHPENSLLGRFHYLSTVSGGSYIGSWLSCWRARDDFSTVVRNLTRRLIEPPEISWLRDYRNYLTPRLGIRSADARGLVAISVRNLVLIWLIVIPIICVPLLALKIIATIFVWVTHRPDFVNDVAYTILLAAVFFMIISQSFTTRHRPTRRKKSDNVSEATFLLRGLLWSIISAILVAMFFSSIVGGYLVERYLVRASEDWALIVGLGGLVPALGEKDIFIIVTAVAGLLVYVVGWIVGLRLRDGLNDFICWALSGLVYGSLIGLGASFYASLDPYLLESRNPWLLLLPIVCGIPWALVSQWIAEIMFLGLISYRDDSDSDREWLSQTSDWLSVSAVVWAVTALIVFEARDIINFLFRNTEHALVAVGFTGVVSALFSKGWTLLIGRTNDDPNSTIAVALKLGIAIVGPVFSVMVVLGLSIILDNFLLHGFLVRKLLDIRNTGLWAILEPLAVGFAAITMIGLLASYFININRFSLYAFRRTRLIRGYLGASNRKRKPDLLTGLDPNDDVRVHQMSSLKSNGNVNSNTLLHVINIALDLDSTKRVGWQERETHPFTITPFHCGSDQLGFRPSREYGGINGGISLGTAMAISGAGVSPNSGYDPVKMITRILTPFNVRLGWWLGNPGPAGDRSYRSSGPAYAGKMLFQELFGRITESNPYVYLSDGGHFEKLGLYEMVRRRCRFIVVIDADCDPQFTFQGLSDAVRKIYNDFGIRITLEGLEYLRNRPNKDDSLPGKNPYHALGRIHYRDADGFEEGCENGYLLYIKPAYHGTEGTGIRSQATANPKFPHEDFDGQWITESQFESYRILGLDITNSVLSEPDVQSILWAYLNPPHAQRHP